MTSYGDFETFLHDYDDKVIRYWVHKRTFTPYEMDKKFSDESRFECSIASFGYIKLCVALGAGDYLVGIEPLSDPNSRDESDDHDLYFFRLSEIRFQILEYDQLTMEE